MAQTKKRRRKKRRKNSTHIRLWVALVLVALFLASAIVCAVMVGSIIPTHWLIIFIILIPLIIIGVILSNRRKATGYIVDFICLLLTVACVTVSVYVGILHGGISQIQVDDTNYTVTRMGVYVMDDDPAEELADISDYNVGIDTLFDIYATDEAVKYAQENVTGGINVDEYENMYDMLDNLRSGEEDAVIINEAYMNITMTDEDISGYEWTAEEIREIESIEVKVPVENADGDDSDRELSDTFIVYISGIDSYDDSVEVSLRSDVNILAVVNTNTKKIQLINTPRDYYVTFEATGGMSDKLTHAGIYGINQSEDALENLYGIEIDYYLRMNFSGFERIIDAMGGITVYSERDFTAISGETYVEGYNTLNGSEALAFSRERKAFADGDFQRARNQMAMIQAMLNKLASFETIANFQAVMNAVAGSFETDMSTDSINSLIKMQLSDGASWDIDTYQVIGEPGFAETYSVPGHDLSVIFQDEDSINEAKNLIQAALSGVDIETETSSEEPSPEISSSDGDS